MTRDPSASPSARALVHATADDLAGTGSRYPDRVAFIDAGEPRAGREIVAALDDDYAVVLVSDDGRERILTGRSLDATQQTWQSTHAAKTRRDERNTGRDRSSHRDA